MLFPVLLTGKLTGEDLSSKTQAAVPALGKDANVARHHGRRELTHHRCVFVHIPVEQLQRKITQKRTVRTVQCLSVEHWQLSILFDSTHPFSVAIMQCGPISTVVTEGHKVGRHEILTGRRMRFISPYFYWSVWEFSMDIAVISLSWILQARIKLLWKTHNCSEFLPWVMTPVNSTSRRASTSNQWMVSSGSAHHAPPYRSSSFPEPCRRPHSCSQD